MQSITTKVTGRNVSETLFDFKNRMPFILLLKILKGQKYSLAVEYLFCMF